MTSPELIATREALRLSQAQLAEALGVSRETVWRWETGRREIPPYLHLALKALA